MSAVMLAEATPGMIAAAVPLGRRAEETWRESLQSLLRSGLLHNQQESLKIIAEPDVPIRQQDLPAGASLFQHRVHRGVWSNWLFAAEHLLAYTDAPWLLICEDDALFCRCAGDALRCAISRPPVALGCFSLYTPKRLSRQLDWQPESWHALTEQPWGSVALCFPREVLERLTREVDRGPADGTDQLVFKYLQRIQRLWYAHYPSLADHIGSASTIGHTADDGARGLDFELNYNSYRSLPVRQVRQVDAGGGIVGVEGQPLVSVVLPVYNDARFVRQAIGSVLAQTYRNIELILVDDGSTDETPQIIDEYRMPNIRRLQHERNRKLPAALNTGFAAAQGQFLTWISSDNMCHPQMLGEMVAYLATHPEADVVYSDMESIDEHGDSLGLWETGDIANIDSHNPVGLSFLYRRKVYEEIGDYDESLFLAEDYHFWLRVSRRFRIEKLAKPLHYYRRHPGQLTEKYKEEVRRATMEAQRSVGAEPVAQLRVTVILGALDEGPVLDGIVDLLSLYASLGAERRVLCLDPLPPERQELLEGLAETYSLAVAGLDGERRFEAALPHLRWADLVFNFGPQPLWRFAPCEPPPNVKRDPSITFSTAVMHSFDPRDDVAWQAPPGVLGGELHGFGDPRCASSASHIWRRLQEESEEERWQAAAEWLLHNTQSPFLILAGGRMEWSQDAAYLLLQGLNDHPRSACWVLDLPRWGYRTGWHTERGWFPLRGDFSSSRAYCFSRAALTAFMAEEHPFFHRLGVGQGLSHWGPAYGHAPSLAKPGRGLRQGWNDAVGFERRCEREPLLSGQAWHGWRPLVSLILSVGPEFSGPGALANTINSVLQQSYQNWELLIVPASPIEQQLHWLRYHPRIEVFAGQRGQHPRLTGLESCSGELIGWLDRPHQLEVSALAAAVTSLLNSPQDELLRSGGRFWDGERLGEELPPQHGEFFLLRRQALQKIDPLKPQDWRLATFNLARNLYLHHVQESLV